MHDIDSIWNDTPIYHNTRYINPTLICIDMYHGLKVSRYSDASIYRPISTSESVKSKVCTKVYKTVL